MTDFMDANEIARKCGTDAVRKALDEGAVFREVDDQARSESCERKSAPGTRRTSQEDWSDPKPLPSGLAEVPVFSPDYLPASLAPWASDISDRMQCPPDFVGIPLVVALGSVLGRKLGVRPQRETSWTEVPNCWGCIIGRPGMMKSPAISEVLKPLKKLESSAREENEEALKDFDAAKREYKIRKEAVEQKAKELLKNKNELPANMLRLDEPEEPRARRYIVNDTTYEALGEILYANPSGVLAFRDELVSLLKTLDREEFAAARGFFLTAWNGNDSYTFDRILRGHVYIDAACLSLLGSTQPGKIGDYIHRAIHGGSGDDGLIQRFSLLVWPDQTADYVETDRHPDVFARENAWHVFTTLDQLEPDAVNAERDSFEGLPFLRFDAAALARFQDWRLNLERRLRAGEWHPAIESHFAKYRKLVPALALVNHLSDRGVGPIPERPLVRAIEFSKYLEKHAYRVYSAGRQHEINAAQTILKRIRKGDLEDDFTAREVYQRNWSNLTDREQVQAALQLLVDFGWLANMLVTTGGRPTTKYLVNPRVRQ
jgi:hypothetical protein